MNYLLDPFLVALVFFGATLVPMFHKRVERILPRLALCVWFVYLWIFPDALPVELQRIVARWLVLLLGLVEIDVEIARFIFARWIKIPQQRGRRRR